MDNPRRKNIRLSEYDYTQNGAYFVTICTKKRENLFWVAAKKQDCPNNYQLTETGKVVENAIQQIPQHYQNICVEKYVVMPNHVHMILMFHNPEGETNAPSLSRVINQLKGYVTKEVKRVIWQARFYDRVIRNDAEFLKIWSYIDTNPMKWREDSYNVLWEE